MNEQPATAKGLSTREKILEAARKQLIQNGYETFVLRELADSLEIKLGNLQYYFKTKEALVLEVMRLEGAEDVATIRKQIIRQPNPEAALDAITDELVSRWRSRRGSIPSTLGTLSLHNKAFQQLYRNIYLSFYHALETLLKDLNPAFSEKEVKLRTRMIAALIDGSSMQIRSGKADEYLAEVRRQVRRMAQG